MAIAAVAREPHKNKELFMSETIFITGASSGLGWQMAIEFARRGHRLALTARRLDSLQALKQKLEAEFDAKVFLRALDVTDYPDVAQALEDAKNHFGDLDKVIANAGIGYSQRIGKLSFDKVKATIDTNVLGLMATVDAAVCMFKQQGHGHIVAISSVAGTRGLPAGGAYSASKAAVTTYIEALRAELYFKPIDVTLLLPGYIDTPINQAARSRPFCITLEKGGHLLADLIERKVKRATVPRWPWAIVVRLLPWLPVGLIARMG